MYSFKTKHRIRYADVDQMKFAYYGNYAKYYEIGRVETIRSLGFSYKDLEEKLGIILPVVKMESRYIKPAFYDDLITIDTKIPFVPSKMIEFHCDIYNPSEELINKGIIKLLFVEMKTGKRVSAPEVFTNKLAPYFEN